MRFFTNDRDETRSEQTEAAAVPQQRPPSPWAAAPGEQAARPGDAAADGPDGTTVTDQPGGDRTEDALVDEGTFDDPKVPGAGEQARPFFGTPAERETAERETAERETAQRTDAPAGPGEDPDGEPPFREPAAQPTAFGAATVGGAVAASAMAGGPADQQRDDTDRRTDAASGVADDRSVTGSGRAEADNVDTVAYAGAPDERDGGATATAPAADSDRAPAHRADDDAVGAALQDGGTFEDPVVVQPGGPAQAFADTSAQSAEGAAARLFAGVDADRFRSRWRDVQLRFVDDPRAATVEAAGLIDEAVDALTAGIRSQKAGLAGPDGDDTEQLRVQLRSYREFLNRLLDL